MLDLVLQSESNRQSQRIDSLWFRVDGAVKGALKLVRSGWSEKQVADVLQRVLADKGVQVVPWLTLVWGSSRSAIVDQRLWNLRPSRLRLGDGDSYSVRIAVRDGFNFFPYSINVRLGSNNAMDRNLSSELLALVRDALRKGKSLTLTNDAVRSWMGLHNLELLSERVGVPGSDKITIVGRSWLSGLPRGTELAHLLLPNRFPQLWILDAHFCSASDGFSVSRWLLDHQGRLEWVGK